MRNGFQDSEVRSGASKREKIQQKLAVDIFFIMQKELHFVRQQLERTKEKLRISRGKKSADDIIKEDRSQAQHYQEQLNQLTQR